MFINMPGHWRMYKMQLPIFGRMYELQAFVTERQPFQFTRKQK